MHKKFCFPSPLILLNCVSSRPVFIHTKIHKSDTIFRNWRREKKRELLGFFQIFLKRIFLYQVWYGALPVFFISMMVLKREKCYFSLSNYFADHNREVWHERPEKPHFSHQISCALPRNLVWQPRSRTLWERKVSNILLPRKNLSENLTYVVRFSYAGSGGKFLCRENCAPDKAQTSTAASFKPMTLLFLLSFLPLLLLPPFEDVSRANGGEGENREKPPLFTSPRESERASEHTTQREQVTSFSRAQKRPAPVL